MCYFSSFFFLGIKSNIFSFYRLDLHISKKPVAIDKVIKYTVYHTNIQYIISFKINSLWRINAQPSIYLALKLSKFSYYSLNKQQIDSEICMKSVFEISVFMKQWT